MKLSRRVKLLKKHTMQQLVIMAEDVRINSFWKVGDSTYNYRSDARKLLDDISWAITWKLKNKNKGEKPE